MRRHTALPIAAVTAAGLLLAGCSGDGGSGDDGGVAGAGPAASATPEATDDPEPEESEPEPEAEPEDGIDRPDIELPDDVINVFEEVDTDDPVELAVLADQERHINAVDEAITSGRSDREGLPFYTSGDALLFAIDYFTTMEELNRSFSGTTRYYNRTVTLREEGAATTSYCMDATDSYLYDVDTEERFPEDGTLYIYTSRLEQNDEGVWQTVSYASEEANADCA